MARRDAQPLRRGLNPPAGCPTPDSFGAGPFGGPPNAYPFTRSPAPAPRPAPPRPAPTPPVTAWAKPFPLPAEVGVTLAPDARPRFPSPAELGLALR